MSDTNGHPGSVPGSTEPSGSASTAEVGPERVRVSIRRLDPDLPLPVYAHHGDAGADVYARVDVLLSPGERALVPTGIALALPQGYAAFGHPRSGLAAHHGVTIVNAPGTVDAGYRGEIFVNLVNLDATEPFQVRRGDRIAQLVVQRVAEAVFVEVDSLPDSSRGDTGHGASGGFGAARQVTVDGGVTGAPTPERPETVETGPNDPRDQRT